MIQIIDYGMGNIIPVLKCFQKIDKQVQIISDVDAFNLKSEILVLPGVGSWDQGIKSLKDKGFDELLTERDKSGNKILGICLGFQLFGAKSQEGMFSGLGLIQEEVLPVSKLWSKQLRTNNGWSKCIKQNCPSQIVNEFYFTHSYGFDARSKNLAIESADVLVVQESNIVAAIQKSNLVGLQFHPERSHLRGEKFLANLLATWSF
jgi:glutamine amidotransferase